MEYLLERVPQEYHGVFVTIAEMVDQFCQEYLDEDYEQLCLDMAITICQEGLPITKGRPRSWAAGIVHAVGWVNFLQDPNTEPYMSADDLAKGFGVSKATVAAKSKVIRDGLEMMAFDPRWCLPDMLEHNPLVWMIEVNGFVMDVRSAPRAIQEEAYRKGLIPYIPEPKEEPGARDEDEPRTIKFPTQERKPSKPKPRKKVMDEGPGLFD